MLKKIKIIINKLKLNKYMTEFFKVTVVLAAAVALTLLYSKILFSFGSLLWQDRNWAANIANFGNSSFFSYTSISIDEIPFFVEFANKKTAFVYLTPSCTQKNIYSLLETQVVCIATVHCRYRILNLITHWLKSATCFISRILTLVSNLRKGVAPNASKGFFFKKIIFFKIYSNFENIFKLIFIFLRFIVKSFLYSIKYFLSSAVTLVIFFTSLFFKPFSLLYFFIISGVCIFFIQVPVSFGLVITSIYFIFLCFFFLTLMLLFIFFFYSFFLKIFTYCLVFWELNFYLYLNF